MTHSILEKLAILGIILSPLLFVPVITWCTSDHRPKSDEEVAWLAMKNGDLKEASSLFTSMILKRPNDPWLKTDRAQAQLMLGNDSAALFDLDQAIGLAPEEKQMSYAYIDRGELFLKLGKYRQAADDFTKAMDLNPLPYGQPIRRARAFLGLKDYSRVVDDCTLVIQNEKAGTMNSAVEEAYHYRAQAYRALGRLDEAKRDEEMAAKNGIVK